MSSSLPWAPDEPDPAISCERPRCREEIVLPAYVDGTGGEKVPCSRERCGRLFAPKRAGQIYCSRQCSQADSTMKRYYAKKKREAGEDE